MVKPGYKRTEVGIIPEDWKVKTIADLADVKGGKRLPLGSSLSDFETPYPYIRVADMFFGGVSLDDIKYVPEDIFPAIRNYRISKEDIFITVAGTLGVVGIVPPELDGGNLTENADKITKISCEKSFLLHILMSPRIQDTISSYKTIGAQPKLALIRIKKFTIPLPMKIAEQRAIANALSDVDGLISALDKLIAKKRAIKTAAMQQLLTGKTRLPGFGGKWSKITFQELADSKDQWAINGGPFGSNLKSTDYTEKGVRIIQLQNIGDGKFLDEYSIFTSERKANELISCNIYPGEIIISKLIYPYARACIIPSTYPRYLMCSDGIRLKVNNKRFNVNFIHSYINFQYFRKIIDDASTGSTRQRIGLMELKKLIVNAPDLIEQEAIAQVLSDMDGEIAALEARRDKTKAIKQGMMQELLTGRTRLL